MEIAIHWHYINVYNNNAMHYQTGGKPLSDPKTREMIGYCPQVDPLLELMNGYETLYFFGRIRGFVLSYILFEWTLMVYSQVCPLNIWLFEFRSC